MIRNKIEPNAKETSNCIFGKRYHVSQCCHKVQILTVFQTSSWPGVPHFYRTSETRNRQHGERPLKAEVSPRSATCDWVMLSGLAALQPN